MAAKHEFIEIEGDVMRIVERTVIDEKKLSDVLPTFETRLPILSPILPRSTILFHWDETNPRQKTLKILVEALPGIKNVVKEGYRFKLAMPWSYFYFECVTSGDANGTAWEIGVYKAYHAKNKVTSMDSPLAVAFLPNVDETGRICYGSTAPPNGTSLADRIDTMVNEWYVTLFTDHLVEDRVHPRPFGADNWRPWVDATEEFGPTAYLRFPEWDNKACYRWTPSQLFGLAKEPKAPVIELSPTIPEVQLPMTFGRAEEWAKERLDDAGRLRLLVALQNLQKDEPKMFVAPEPKGKKAEIIGAAEDGGEKIETGQRDYR